MFLSWNKQKHIFKKKKIIHYGGLKKERKNKIEEWKWVNVRCLDLEETTADHEFEERGGKPLLRERWKWRIRENDTEEEEERDFFFFPSSSRLFFFYFFFLCFVSKNRKGERLFLWFVYSSLIQSHTQSQLTLLWTRPPTIRQLLLGKTPSLIPFRS